MCKKYAEYLVISKNCCTFAADLHKECFFDPATSGLPRETLKLFTPETSATGA